MTQENVSNQGKGAIFDLDGTLLDSMGVWDQVDVDFLAKRGFEVPDDYMQKVAAMQFRQIAEYTIAPVGHSRSVDGGVGPYGTCHVLHGGRSQAARA